MTHKELDKKRLSPCFAEIYATADSPVKGKIPNITYEFLNRWGVWGYHGDEVHIVVPMDVFHIDSNKMSAIVAKWCKGLHKFWYYTPKLDFKAPDYKDRVKELEDFRKFEDDVHKDKTLTYAQRAAKIRKEALKHNFRERSSEAEYISINIHLGCPPTSNMDVYRKNVELFNAIYNAYKDGVIPITYVDYTNKDAFEYTKEGTTYSVVKENILYYRPWIGDHAGDVVKKETPDAIHYNIYDNDGNWVEEVYDIRILGRSLSANSLEGMVTKAYEYMLKATGISQELYDSIHKDDVHKTWVYEYIRQCVALLVMLVWYGKDE